MWRVPSRGQALALGVLTAVLLAGCEPDAKPALGPALLFDSEQMAAYLDAFPAEDYQIAEVPDLGRFYVDDNPAQVKRALLSGVPWETHVIRELKAHLAPGDTALDIGAHIGSLTMAMARLVGSEGTVYAFEPQKKIYRELVHNLRLNEVTNVVPLRYALSAKPGIIEMDPASGFDGRVQVGEGGDEVEARRLDSFAFPELSLIKIDVEGHEVAVLHGASKAIEKHHPVIIIEIWQWNSGTVMPILRSHGYSVRQIGSHDYVATYDPRP